MPLVAAFVMALAVLLQAASSVAAELINARPIESGGPKGLAPLAFQNSPLGSAFTRKSPYPDIFTLAVLGIETPAELCRCQYLYSDPSGQLVYTAPEIIGHPWRKNLPSTGRIFNSGGDVLGLWIEGDKRMIVAKLKSREFVKIADVGIAGISRQILGLEVSLQSDNEAEIVLLESDGLGSTPAKNADDTESLYDGAGSYRGKLPRCGLYGFKISLDTFAQISPVTRKTADDDVAISGSRVIKVRSAETGLDGFIVTNTIGALKYLPEQPASPRLPIIRHVFGSESTVLYHPGHGAAAIPFGPRDMPQSQMVIGGERAFYHYVFAGRITAKGEPIYSEPKPILQENADLFAGALDVPNVVDWDGDGRLDIVAGNSEGRLLFFKNNGTNRQPDFALPTPIESGGVPIVFRPGYNIVQGPLEAAWGYLSPTVFDWNGDGMLDVIFSGSRSKFEVMINRGTKTKPALAAPVTLRIDNMELPGTWRVRPAVGKIGGRTAIMIMDTDDALHLYWRVDDQTVEDGGKVLMADGSTITHRSTLKQSLGQRGRAKLQLVDWDNDGVLDLIIGTSKRSAFPNPQRGMPFSRYEKNQLGLEVVFMRNVGSNEHMRFGEPVQFQVDGKDLYLGTHEYGPYACELGDTSRGLNLIVGVQSGKIYFFDRKNLTTIGFGQ